MHLTRRFLIRAGTLAASLPILDRLGGPVLGPAHAQGEQERQWRHGLSLFGELKYPQAFKHFDYVNPNAPKGGSVRLNFVSVETALWVGPRNDVHSSVTAPAASGFGFASTRL